MADWTSTVLSDLDAAIDRVRIAAAVDDELAGQARELAAHRGDAEALREMSFRAGRAAGLRHAIALLAQTVAEVEL